MSRSEPQRVPRAVRNWAAALGDAAVFETGEEAHGWWIRVTPRAPGACGFTLGISDEGEYDLFLDLGLSQEGWPWPAATSPEELCAAIAAGRVSAIRRLWRSREVRRRVEIEMPGDDWWDLRASPLDLLLPRRFCTEETIRAAPYLRATPAEG